MISVRVGAWAPSCYVPGPVMWKSSRLHGLFTGLFALGAVNTLGALGACDGPFVTAAHTPLPQLTRHEGVVLAAPQLVTITFPGYPFRDGVESFGDFVGGSAWLRAVGAEYGIGAGSQLQKVVWPTDAPDGLTDQGLRALLAQGISDGLLPAPPASDSSLVYLVYWPAGPVLDASSAGAGVLCLRGAHSAGGLFTAGYHESLPAPGGGRVPYAVIGDCESSLESITTIASRELIGAATNPYEIDLSGYLLDVQPDDPWLMNLDNGEAGYLCEGEPPVIEAGHALHRSWSNAAAAAGHAPCVPADNADPYVTVSAAPASITTVSPGAPVTLTITGWSTGPTPPWALRIHDADGSDFDSELLLPQLSRSMIGNGDTTTLTITVPATARTGQYAGLNLLSGDHEHMWPIAVTVR